jgi:cell division transport system permease protein
LKLMLRSDLPLSRDGARFFLPAITGFMAFIAGLALVGSLAIDNLLTHWRGAIEATFTVQLPPVEGESASATNDRRSKALAAIADFPGIRSAILLSNSDKAKLLEPWLGPDAARLDLPLPDLIAVTSRPGSTIDVVALAARLQVLSPGASIDDHGHWRDAMARATRLADFALLCLLALIGLAAALTVVFVTRAGLAAHGRVIEILHLVGAHDAYVAGQFQRHAFLRAFTGGAAGTLAAAVVFLAAQRLLPGPDQGDIFLGPLQWLALALLPVAAALLAMLTARYTVLRSLRRIL